MRSNIFYRGDKIQKQYTIDSRLRKYYELHFQNYLGFIESISFIVPETKWSISGTELSITQKRINPITPDYSRILDVLLHCESFDGYWGLDSNPQNFICNKDGQINFIDFNPLLYNDNQLLGLQFNYSYNLIYERYFKKVNIIATFLIRINLIDQGIFQILLSKAKIFLYKHFDGILPREKVRLLQCLKEKSESYSKFYTASKEYTSISIDQESDLKFLLKTH